MNGSVRIGLTGWVLETSMVIDATDTVYWNPVRNSSSAQNGFDQIELLAICCCKHSEGCTSNL
jgi:hypothetical protein